jgi:hypothetical protein
MQSQRFRRFPSNGDCSALLKSHACKTPCIVNLDERTSHGEKRTVPNDFARFAMTSVAARSGRAIVGSPTRAPKAGAREKPKAGREQEATGQGG